MRPSDLRRRLRDAPIPDEHQARERGWRVVRAAFEAAPPVSRRRATPRLAIAVAVGLLLLAVGLSPAGAKVVNLLQDVTGVGEPTARPTLTSLPASGTVLATTGHAAWVVHDDGSKRRLGAYRSATWSPGGLFVAVTHGRSLTAVEPDGTVRWSLSQRRPVSDPAWAPSGYRVAYLAGHELRVVAGDGTGDRVLVPRVSSTPPAWLPNPSRNLLTYVDDHGVVRVVDVDSGAELWHTAAFGGRPVRLTWSRDGTRLMVFTPSFFVVLDAKGRAVFKGAGHGRIRAAALAPSGGRIAMVDGSRGKSRLVLFRPSSGGPSERTIYSGPGRFADVRWSPDGSLLLVTWPDADQWLFVRPEGGNVDAVANVSRQFAPGGKVTEGFPRVSGWCCPP
jgi:hypothetical protein